MAVRRGARKTKKMQRKAPGLPQAPVAGSTPHLGLVRAPLSPSESGRMRKRIAVATYNVHRWTGINGRGAPDPARAGFVISELRADVIALQEVLRPHRGEDPLEAIADALGLHVAFACTRVHKRGELGNAILSRWPMSGVSVLDLSFSRMERRLAMAAQFAFDGGELDVVATHLSLGDRTRHRQVRSLLDHPRFGGGPTLLLGDMNAWRQCKATRALDDELHNNMRWPPSFPAARPVLALDRIYSRGVEIIAVEAHRTGAARSASDHLPVVAEVQL
ncbi:MAG: endonuclease/exonuclease/phosphatase family protein [Deltaproteobacteria bacterium]|nr:endonuclease/exonuclease/phosphatase family protein [Deltaproteobacteria bacterium]